MQIRYLHVSTVAVDDLVSLVLASHKYNVIYSRQRDPTGDVTKRCFHRANIFSLVTGMALRWPGDRIQNTEAFQRCREVVRRSRE